VVDVGVVSPQRLAEVASPTLESAEQTDVLIDSLAAEGDAIVENKSGRKAAMISYDEFLFVSGPSHRRSL
jgi:hypothetical protein